MKIFYLKFLVPIFILIANKTMFSQQIITEYSYVNAKNPIKNKHLLDEKNYKKILDEGGKKIFLQNQSVIKSVANNTKSMKDATLNINLDFDPEQFDAPMMIFISDESGYVNFAEYEGVNPISIQVPEGTYDITAEFVNIHSGRTHLIIKEQQNTTENEIISINPIDADNYISINALDDNGEILQPGVENSDSGLSSEVFFDRLIRFNPTGATSGTSYTVGIPFNGDPVWNFYINDISDRYSIFHSFMGSGYEKGYYFTKFPAINNVSENTSLQNDPDSWVYHTEKFHPSDLGTTEIYPGFSISSFFDGNLLNNRIIYNTAKTINPEEAFKGFLNNTIDDAPIQFLISPAIVDHFSDWEEGFSIIGNPVFSTFDGSINYGSGDISKSIFFLGDSYYLTENLQRKVFPFHPKFTFSQTDAYNVKQGDNVPIIVTAALIFPDEVNQISELYKGRYGENRESDFFATQVEAKQSGSTVFMGDYIDFLMNYSLPTNGNMQITFINANNTIEGLDGINTTTITYNADREDAPPTLQHLQFRDINGKVTDRFASASEGTVRLAAGDFQFTIINSWFGYYDYNPGNTVNFSYSKHDQNSWTEIPFINYPEYFQMPAFGDYYEASLSSIQETDSNVWYDAKIICTDAAGNKQEQIISPAFKINSTMAVNDVKKSDLTVYPNPFTNELTIQLPENMKGNVTFKVTDLSGKTVYTQNRQNEKSFVFNGSSLAKGVYIVTVENNGKVVAKKVIKK